MDIAKIIGENLRYLQEKYDYSQSELGEIVDVTRQTVAKYLNGEQVVDSGKLYKFAQHFNKSIDYFLNANNNKEKLSFMFRADNPAENFHKDLYNYIGDRFNKYYKVIELSDIEIKDYIPEEYNLNLKGNKLSQKQKNVIENIALKQRRYMGVNEAINIDAFKVFEDNNINVIAEELENNDLEALSAYSKEKGAFIFINDNSEKPEERKLFSLAHELGHLIMHRDEYQKNAEKLEYTSSKIKDIREKAADYFAMSFLVSRDILQEHYKYELDGFINLDIIYDIKKDFGVSAKCLLRALKEYDIIEDNVFGYLLNQLNKNGFEKTEPKPRSYIKKNYKLISLTRKLLFEDKITINKAAEILNYSSLEMREKVKEWKQIELIKN